MSFGSSTISERGAFQAEALKRLKVACDRYGSHGLGVEFDSIAVVDLHPPAEVVDAYYEVAKAMERRDQRVNAATEKATRRLKAALADAAQIEARARATGLETKKLAEGERARFLSQQRARRGCTSVVYRQFCNPHRRVGNSIAEQCAGIWFVVDYLRLWLPGEFGHQLLVHPTRWACSRP